MTNTTTGSRPKSDDLKVQAVVFSGTRTGLLKLCALRATKSNDQTPTHSWIMQICERIHNQPIKQNRKSIREDFPSKEEGDTVFERITNKALLRLQHTEGDPLR